ncbi:MAG: SdpI family protein [Bacteroidia bacterium]
MKNLLKKDWLIWIILLVPFAVVAYYWNRFPEQIPMHWNIKGEVDDYSSKGFGLFFPLVLNIGMYFLFKALPYIDPKKSNYALFKSKLHIIQLALHVFMSSMAITTNFVALGYKIDIAAFVNIGIVLLILVLGNYLSTIRPNYFIGIRTPWTLANEDVWVKTHRFTGRLWVAASLLMILLFIFFPFEPAIVITYLVIIILPPFIYSYLQFRKTEKNNTNHFML